ncbi:MAG: polysaccharide deacetylase family protein [Clostridiales bacterium]|nr:polysaccharide deacetylase family protein [Clostridiales bacterium]
MPQSKKRPVIHSRRYLARRRRRKRLMLFGLAALAVAALLLILLLPRGPAQDTVTAPLAGTSEPTAAPTISPSPSPTPLAQQFLPVINRVTTSKNQIAVTIDDLNEVNNLNQIMELAHSLGAKLTLFPIGNVIESKPALQAALRTAHSWGFEIENHTWTHSDLFGMTDERMAQEVWNQQMAVNKALGVEYDPHFIRMHGGLGETCGRSHQYLIQLGTYKGVADWSWSGSGSNLDEIKAHTGPGSVFLFHAKDSDLKKLQAFIPWAVSQGYELVTLNELLGYGPNETRPLTYDPATRQPPVPLPYEYTDYVLLGKKPNIRLYAVKLLQERLANLGYFSADVVCDGDYGSLTKAAVTLFQKAGGLHADGLAGIETQTLLFGPDAPRNPYAAVTPAPKKK